MEEGLWYEGIFYLATINNHINLGVSIKGLSEEELHHFEGSGRSMRHLKFFSINNVCEENLLPLLKLVYTRAQNNR